MPRLAARRPYPPLANGNVLKEDPDRRRRLSLAFAGVNSCSEFLFPQMFTGEYVVNVSIRYNGSLVSSQFNLSLFGTPRVFADANPIP
jgi:hypothetical protein